MGEELGFFLAGPFPSDSRVDSLRVGAFDTKPGCRALSLSSNIWEPISFLCRRNSIWFGQYTLDIGRYC